MVGVQPRRRRGLNEPCGDVRGAKEMADAFLQYFPSLVREFTLFLLLREANLCPLSSAGSIAKEGEPYGWLLLLLLCPPASSKWRFPFGDCCPRGELFSAKPVPSRRTFCEAAAPAAGAPCQRAHIRIPAAAAAFVSLTHNANKKARRDDMRRPGLLVSETQNLGGVYERSTESSCRKKAP